MQADTLSDAFSNAKVDGEVRVVHYSRSADDSKNRFGNTIFSQVYYNGNTLLIDNKKYKVPSLESEDGQQWNSASLIGICNLWMNIKRKKERYQHKLSDTEYKILELEKSLLHVKPDKEAQEKELHLSEEKFLRADEAHSMITAKLKYLEVSSPNSDEYIAVLDKFKQWETILMQVKDDIKTAKSKLGAIKDANSNTYQELDFLNSQRLELIHDLKAQDLNIDSKNSQIDPIIDSIVRVLIARTKLVEDL